jgi:hypothetical protein
MRRAALLFALLLCTAPASAAAKPCRLAKHDQVAVHTRTAVIAHRPNADGGDTYRGCLKGVGRWRTLLVEEDSGYGGVLAEIPAVGGRYAGVLAFEGEHYGSGTYWIDLVNLHTGRHRGEFVLGTADGMSGPHQIGITSLVLSSNATIGWIAADYWSDTPEASASSSWSVRGHDASGTRTLDSGESHWTLANLRFSGPTLQWTHDGELRESRLGAK